MSNQGEIAARWSNLALPVPLTDAHFQRICDLIYQRAGLVLASHKRDMVYNRLVRRLRTLGLMDFGTYLVD